MAELRLLFTRQCWANNGSPEVKVGDAALLPDTVHCNTWPMRRVIDVHTGRDGKVRTVTVQNAGRQTSVRKNSRNLWDGMLKYGN